jgi:hypothetical protein
VAGVVEFAAGVVAVLLAAGVADPLAVTPLLFGVFMLALPLLPVAVVVVVVVVVVVGLTVDGLSLLVPLLAAALAAVESGFFGAVVSAALGFLREAAAGVGRESPPDLESMLVVVVVVVAEPFVLLLLLLSWAVDERVVALGMVF